MGVLADWQWRQWAGLGKITPFFDEGKMPGKISRGVSHYGYDLTLAPKFHVFNNTHCCIVDPKNFDKRAFTVIEGDTVLIPPNSFLLAESVETVEVPHDCIALVCNKSTYARCGIACPSTLLEPQWKGVVTLEIANHSPLPAKIYANEGIAQVLFLRGDHPCAQGYNGRYQDQTGVTLPFVSQEKQ